MDVVPNQSRRHVISGLKPYTQYAYFVKTLTRTEYHIQIDAYSKIGYFQTLPDRPSPVLRIYGSSEISSQIVSTFQNISLSLKTCSFPASSLVATEASKWSH